MTELVAIQMVSGPEPEVNFQLVESYLQHLAVSQPTLVVLPECFARFGCSDKDVLNVAEAPGHGEMQQRLSHLARQFGVWLVAGTIPLQSNDAGKFTASCLLYDDTGKHRAEYQKIHLFDVDVKDNTGSYRESRYTQPGRQLAVVEDTPFGRLGLAVCYDLRFPGLFQAMGQVDVLAVPAAFTYNTGKAHWQTLVQARSIENQCYLVAANQGGVHANQRQTYGHSQIVSPWGEALASLTQGAGIITATIQPGLTESIRRSMPVATHNQFRSEFIEPR